MTFPSPKQQPPPASLRLRVDAEALAGNYRALNAMSGDAAAGAAVKADVYGLGTGTCVPVLRAAGCQQFFVAHWSEAAAVAHHVPAAQVAVLHGPMNSADADYARATGVVPVINSLEQARRWAQAGGGICHLMVDTGINRLGVSPQELSDPAIAALNIDVLMSHLANADEDSTMNTQQLEAFCACLPMVKHRRASLANSAGIGLGQEYAFELTRPGIALYGGIPRAELAGSIRQVAYPQAAVIQTRTLNAGDKVGYNGRFTAPAEMQVGTVSLGYADGFLRARGAGGALTHEGRILPLLGTVSMDMVVVDLSHAPDIQEGDWLDVPFNLPVAAQHSSVSQYELLTVMGKRLRA